MSSVVVVYLGIGTNLGDREKNISDSLGMISRLIGEIISVSSVYLSEPWGFESENDFLNMVAAVKTSLKPYKLLKTVHIIEERLGRIRGSVQFNSRTIDIDILLYGDKVINGKVLRIPHPLMTERKFVLVPICEIAPDLRHPVLHRSFSELLMECRDKGEVVKFMTVRKTQPADHRKGTT